MDRLCAGGEDCLMMIPYADPKAQYLSHKDEIDVAVKRVIDSGWYILGKEVENFEKEFAAYIGVKHAIGVGSGTEALHLALVACGVEPGDEVVTVSHTAVATIAAIRLAGATPVFADIDPETYTMDPDSFRKTITKHTKIVIPVHIYGHPADMEAIVAIAREHDLIVIEDCAQAHGAAIGDKKMGTFGDMACFSFYPTKNLGALGDGGAVITDDQKLAGKARLFREYGWAERFISRVPGWNTRLDELQAAILRVKLKYLDEDNAARCKLAAIYKDGLADTKLILPYVRQSVCHVYHLFVVCSENRDELIEFLRSKNIGAAVHYPVPVHLQPAYSGFVATGLVETERMVREIVSLPMYPELTENNVLSVVKAIKEID